MENDKQDVTRVDGHITAVNGKPIIRVNGRLAKGTAPYPGACWKKGQSGNPGGRAKKFTTLLSDALKERLGDITPKQAKTYAMAIADDMIRATAKLAKKCADRGSLDKTLVTAIAEIRDTTEGRPQQSLELKGNVGISPAERVKELLQSAMERAGNLEIPKDEEEA